MALSTAVLGGVGLLLNFLLCVEAGNENEVIDVWVLEGEVIFLFFADCCTWCCIMR
jgi:hypothetical protein